MAADTPVMHPLGTGLYFDAVIVLQKRAYSGAGSQREARWQIATDSTFPAVDALVWDSLLREDDGRQRGDDWIEVFSELVPLRPETTYYASVMVRNTLDESSSWASPVTFTTSPNPLTATVWEQAQ